MLRRSARLLAAAAAAVGTTVLAAACGAAPGSPSAAQSPPPGAAARQATPAASASAGTPAPGPSAAVTAGTAACSTSDLTVTADTSLASGSQALFGTIGGTYVPIDFINDFSTAPCTLYGYPGVSYVTSPTGTQIGPAAGRASLPAPVTVTLAPGGAAHAFLLVSNATPAGCRVVTAHSLRIYPPGRRTAAYASFSARVCSGSVARGNLLITAVQAGEARPGQSPPVS